VGFVAPAPVVDVNQQQVDLRRVNSWLLKLEQVRPPSVCRAIPLPR